MRDRPFPSREGVVSIADVLDETDLLRHRPEILRHCARMLGSAHDAEDALQDTFLRAWQRRGTYRGGSLRAWLYAIATNVCMDAIARRGRVGAAGEVAELPAPREHEPDA